MIAATWKRLVGFGFRLLYNEMALTYDIVSWAVSLGEWRTWQRSVMPFLPVPSQGKILDLAHGTGNLHLDLQEAGYAVSGVDLSRAMGQITQRKFARLGKDVRLVQADAQRLPFADAAFSAIVSTFPTNFIIARGTLSELQRVLQPNGVVVVVLHGVLSQRGLVERSIDGLYRVTGQSGVDGLEPFVEAFMQAGFDARIETIAYPRSYAQLIVATPKNTLDSR